ncbi:MAG: UbiD family decarboxylase [Candidatus Parvarchaeota archaeon]|nr:UbiD family decarboxylase [Candidatus Jingweiarchaeum tengchongense]MCW1298277.1 UbiD family decarboxylase [Candidatus Jingweiarchaeum tengchongense]MCW1300368.1 UbiD family decarboxylase [Candidatus Jingweiarchaeum tengchongense]MCW1304787.1 UbiD family decarboxylase [Candidatus Jingweiarchaeum tengchongense]MCW1305377.1 UbiD family decarboxylase [Candidatus Jingweiarchaeum tengchongense]
MELEDTIKLFDKNGDLIRIKDKVSTEYEIAENLIKYEPRPVIFERVSGYKTKVVGNIFASRENIASIIGVKKEEILFKLMKAMENPIPTKLVKNAKCQEVIEKDVDLNSIPILKHFKKDAGKYITAGFVIAKDKENGKVRRNASVHRLLVKNKDELLIRIVPRHLYEILQNHKERNENPKVAICIGAEPACLIAASMQVPREIFEMEIASSLLNRELEMTKCKTIDLEVPANSNYVLEGEILLDKKEKEGPFIDITGTYDIIREEHVVKINAITHRKEPIYQALLPGFSEHQLLMGLPQEPKIYRALQSAEINVQRINLTRGGCNWFHAIISIKKKKENEGKNAIMAAFTGHPSLKKVTVVDDDIDVFNMEEVEWAEATRLDPLRGIIKYEAAGSTLDKIGKGNKWGIDATLPLEILNDEEKFQTFVRVKKK